LVFLISTRKGQKRLKNQPVLHQQLKRPRTIWLTPETWEQMQELAAKNGLSSSEYVEQLIRKCHTR
jgi:aspartate/tyrosine/aromatic aminotransferase